MERPARVKQASRRQAADPAREQRPAARSHLSAPAQALMVQPKLWVGSSRDPLEREADRAADRIVGQVYGQSPAAEAPRPAPVSPPPLQRQAETEETREEETESVAEGQLVQRMAAADPDPEEGAEGDSDEDIRYLASAGGGGDGGHPAPEPIRLRPAPGGGHARAMALDAALGQRIHSATRQRGSPLEGPLRQSLEPLLDADLSGVRVHRDAEAASLNAALRARAFTVGGHIFFGQNQYAPQTRSGLHLLGHELGHVQQQLGGDFLARDGEDIFPNREVPSAILAVGLFGMDFYPADNSTFSGGETRYESMAIVLKRLLGSRYRRGIEPSVYTGLRERVGSTGTFYGGMGEGVTAREGASISTIRFDIGAAVALVSVLEGMGYRLQLTDEERERLELGRTTRALWNEIRLQMPGWYTYRIFESEMSQQGVLLRAYRQAARPGASGGEAGRVSAYTALIAVLRPPAFLLERIRQDTAIARLIDAEARTVRVRNSYENAVIAYALIWGVGVEQLSTLQTPPAVTAVTGDETRQARVAGFLSFSRTQPQLLERGQQDDGHASRVEIMARFGRHYRHRARAERRTGRVLDHPARANAPAWNATLSVTPPLLPPLFSAALETDHSFSMSLHFDHWVHAFARYSFVWERIRIPERRGRAGAAPEVPDLDQMAGETPTLGEVYDTRMRRARRYNATDIQRIRDATGVPFGTAAHDLVEVNNILRLGGTVVRYALERLTQPRHVKPIVFPGPGLYVVRCRALPVLDGDEEVVRLPSVAYQPVVAQDPTQMAIQQVEGTARTRFQARLRIAEIMGLLGAPFPPANVEDLRAELQYLQSMLQTPQQRLTENERQLAAQIRTLEERIRLRAEIRTLAAAPEASRDEQGITQRRARLRELGGPGSDWLDERSLSRLRSQHDTAADMLATRNSRVRGETGVPMELVASFVSDLGQSISLVLETYDRGPVNGAREVFISDLTMPQSGIGTGRSTHAPTDGNDALRDAVELALRDLLETSSDYGRGRVAYRVHGSIHHMRVEAGTGRMLMEALENATMLISIAAIAAAPFTGGSSLYILLPAGALGAVPSVYRLYNRYRAGTLRFDLATVMDVVNIVGGIVGLAQVATPLRMVRLGRALMIMGIGADGAGILLMGAGVVQQIAALQNLPEHERAARLLEILGSAMLQIGIMAGGSLAHARYQGRGRGAGTGDDSPGFHPPREGVDGGAGGRPRVEPDAPAAGDRSMAGAGRPGDPGGTTPAVPPRRTAADARSPERLLDRLSQGVDRSLPPPRPAAEVPNPPASGPFPTRRRLRTADQAYTAYNEALAVSAGREVAVYHNPSTGEFVVRIGGEGSVSGPGPGWNAVVHYHPNPGNVLTYRLPAPADFQGLLMRYFAEGGLVREFVEFDIPGVGRGRTEYGIESGHAEPFYVRISYPDGTQRTIRFANDGAYQVYWGSRTTHVTPGTPEYQSMIADIQRYLRDRQPDLGPGPMRPTGERTAAGTGSGSGQSQALRLQDASGNLTADGLAFIRGRYRTMRDGRRRIPLSELTDAQIQEHFHNNPNWLETLVVAEVRSTWLGRGTGTDFLMANTRQDFNGIATRLQAAIDAGSTGHTIHDAILGWNVRNFVLEMVRQNDPVLRPAFERLQNHTDPAIRRRWREFKYSTRAGDMYGFFLGEVGRKRPDIVEVLLSQNEIHITDATFAVGDPIHNFKSAFYRVVMERLINVQTVTATDYRAPTRQSPVGP